MRVRNHQHTHCTKVLFDSVGHTCSGWVDMTKTSWGCPQMMSNYGPWLEDVDIWLVTILSFPRMLHNCQKLVWANPLNRWSLYSYMMSSSRVTMILEFDQLSMSGEKLFCLALCLSLKLVHAVTRISTLIIPVTNLFELRILSLSVWLQHNS